MTDDRKAARRLRIEKAAYEVLVERGFSGASMLAIAKRAKASNETLYAWYGDKLGLFRAMVASTAEAARDRLLSALEAEAPEAALVEFGTVLLHDILSDRAVALNRVAAADMGGETGRAIAAAGRESVLPLLTDLLCRIYPDAGQPEALAALFIDLLVGDQQLRRVIGTLPAPDLGDCKARSERAVRIFHAIIETGADIGVHP
ncbi:TetR/AcrR family transcriptional regulator [Rhodovulum sp. P5]|uniref:TetR/AcrR family transcriptional regulator n=1 Tax=Rhodovulum sp. P5 TaxID=1564506 RepID=UPI0009DAA61F|nr:TetR/AcrR family transcriptional regulator [Rhodovulum sp. P5]